MKNTLLITTVGTSLLEKLGREKIKVKGALEANAFFDSNLYNNIEDYCSKNKTADAETTYTAECSDVTGVVNKLKSLLNYPIALPAEIASLSKLAPNKDNDKVVLLYSDTPEGVFCSVVLEQYIKNKIVSAVCRKKIAGLQSEDAKKFQSTGLPNLAEEMAGLINSNKAYRITLNVTGGYKGIIPYLTLMGLCGEDMRMVYLYEESDGIIEIPPLPFNLDFALWNDNRAFLQTLTMVKGIYKDKAQLPVSDKFKSLFEVAASGAITATGYFSLLQGLYSTAKEEKALSEFGRGYILAEMVRDVDKKKKLKAWINNSQNIWYGDNIPETVDHSRGHCQRLLELAAQIIKPIEAKSKVSFFTDDELVVLNLVLWFHDIGHSGREATKGFNDKTIEALLAGSDLPTGQEFIDISDFPTVNRDLHHILGFIEALRDQESKTFYRFKDKADEAIDGFLHTDYLKAAIYAYLYHRKTMLKIKNGVASSAYTFEPLNIEPTHK